MVNLSSYSFLLRTLLKIIFKLHLYFSNCLITCSKLYESRHCDLFCSAWDPKLPALQTVGISSIMTNGTSEQMTEDLCYDPLLDTGLKLSEVRCLASKSHSQQEAGASPAPKHGSSD